MVDPNAAQSAPSGTTGDPSGVVVSPGPGAPAGAALPQSGPASPSQANSGAGSGAPGAPTDEAPPSGFEPDGALPGNPPPKHIVWMGLYLGGLSVLLVYLICVSWPPQPWPKSNARAEAAARIAPSASTSASAGLAQARAASATQASAGASKVQPPGEEPASSSAEGTSAQSTDRPPAMNVFGHDFHPSLDVRLMLIVLFTGALGSFIHAATSFVDFVGNKRFVPSWTGWYLMRPFIGAALALLLYFVVRGGFITGTALSDTSSEAASFINPFGMAALAGLAGLFTKQATDKLNEVFTTLFHPSAGEGDSKRTDKLTPQVPRIDKIDPAQVAKGTRGCVLTITGANFSTTATVCLDSTELTPKATSPTQVTVELPPAIADAPKAYALTVKNRVGNGGSISQPQVFTVTAQ